MNTKATRGPGRTTKKSAKTSTKMFFAGQIPVSKAFVAKARPAKAAVARATQKAARGFVKVPRNEYEELLRLAEVGRAFEDEGTARIVAEHAEAMADGREAVIPAAIAEAMMTGESPVRILRKWRGLTQAQLAEATGLGQGYISDIEKNPEAKATDAKVKIAKALGVPLDLLVE